MRIPLAYISIVLLWATTPLAIKWSGEGPGFLFGVTGRMAIGTLCILLMLGLSRQHLAWHRKALQTYLAVAVQIYGSMLVVYWAAQFIPSGWISVIFGLLPLMTALLAAVWLGERSLTLGSLLAYVLGISGLWVMFGSALQLGHDAVLGIIGVLVSTFLQAVSSIWVKRIDGKIPALSQVTGGLLLSLPAYLITWAKFDGHWPTEISPISLASIVYLGMIATTIGFVLYYYLLIHQSATKVALITLISPVMALLLGHAVNHEPLTMKVATGTLLILGALLMHEFFDRLLGSKPAKLPDNMPN
ncbi:drug/metabolite transporter (DMT)-like permease [Methylobacter tundripaludum]|uniref:Drug/metabolite transporter (DMT)-like permease n=1 Tax=Methylobacter tundripaludum TaxID=173365 RepID=A0A2S6HGK1_9GAMM|nr:DMT family transporter [Methylobacter tundripaludum]PPK76608.1 drug/metabolite transporter (DMT)-like permease [Methylobacter tundripaludum]